MAGKMWAGRFTKEVDERVNDFNSSISFDARMYRYDIDGSMAHATMLGECGIIEKHESEKIVQGLKGILADIDEGKLQFDPTAEDVHMFVEAELTKRLGDTGKRLHTARSRNDQVALDVRMILRAETKEIIELVKKLEHTILDIAEKNLTTVMPGYTHLQRAQPITFAHHLMAYANMLLRDISRLEDYIIDTGFASLGKMVQNFIDLSTFTDPLRTSNFPQNWTIYYWAYWMVWCVAAPFFIGSISRGRTVRQTILGGYVFGVGSTLTSFIVLGNYSMGLQMTGKADFIAKYLEKGDMYGMIVDMIKTMPGAPVVMVAVLVTMIAFYATSFDSIALTASCYSYHALEDDEQPNKGIQLMWCILLILLPIALLFAESSMNNLQSVSIVAAFPIGVVIVMITVSFLKDAKNYMAESTQ